MHIQLVIQDIYVYVFYIVIQGIYVCILHPNQQKLRCPAKWKHKQKLSSMDQLLLNQISSHNNWHQVLGGGYQACYFIDTRNEAFSLQPMAIPRDLLPEQTLPGNETQPLSAIFLSPQANPRTSSTSPSLQQKPSGPHAPDLNPPPHPNPPHYPTTQPKPQDTPPLAPPNLGPSISRPIRPPPTRARPTTYDPTPIPPGVYTL